MHMRLTRPGPVNRSEPKQWDTHSYVSAAIAAVLIVLLLPLLATVSLFIRLDSPGPVLFRQTRGGQYGRHFTIYKFRTMTDSETRDCSNGVDANHSEITKIGAILRKTSIDELPQLLNIVKGEMAFVGPRPTLTVQTDNYNARQMQRLAVKPGVTGLAQVWGRNELTWEEKIEVDLLYIRNRGLLTDMKIILLTIVKVLRFEGIYKKESTGGGKP